VPPESMAQPGTTQPHAKAASDEFASTGTIRNRSEQGAGRGWRKVRRIASSRRTRSPGARLDAPVPPPAARPPLPNLAAAGRCPIAGRRCELKSWPIWGASSLRCQRKRVVVGRHRRCRPGSGSPGSSGRWHEGRGSVGQEALGPFRTGLADRGGPRRSKTSSNQREMPPCGRDTPRESVRSPK